MRAAKGITIRRNTQNVINVIKIVIKMRTETEIRKHLQQLKRNKELFYKWGTWEKETPILDARIKAMEWILNE